MLVINSVQTSGLLGRCQKEILHCEVKLMAVEVAERNLRKQVSCIDTASQLICLAVQIACFSKLASKLDA